MNIEISITNVTTSNKHEKFQKAISKLSDALKIPATIEHKDNHKEEFMYLAQQELFDRYINKFGLIMDDLYSRLCSTIGLRPVSTFMKKAIDPNAPRLLPNEIIWNPETGKPITQKELDKLLSAMDKYLNRNVGPLQEEFTISQAAVSRMISSLRESQEAEKIRNLPLNNIYHENIRWDEITNYKQLEKLFPGEYNRLKINERLLGTHITDLTDDLRTGIQTVLDRGFLSGDSRGKISQDLFYKFGSANKNWDRIIDTEATNIFNAQYIAEEVDDAEEGDDIYFVRREFSDSKTCDFCDQANKNPIIAKYVNTPLQDEKINDPVASIAIWPGKNNIGKKRTDWWWAEGANHPNCRGHWDRYYPEIGDIKL
jgi:hypothetical protein